MTRLRLSLLPLRRCGARQSGVALITTLLLLSLLTALSLSMVLAYRSDMLVNGYNRDMQSSFYAADAGNTIIRQDMSSRIAALVPTTINPGTYPLPSSVTSTIVSAINSAYSTAQPVLSGSTTPQNFKIYTSDTNLSLYSCTVGYYTDATYATKLSATNTASAETGSVTCPTYTYAYNFTYIFHYQLTTIGSAQGAQNAAVTDSGNLIINATSQDTINNFSQYGTFIDKMDICSAMLIGGKITGPQFTNGSWTFGYAYSYNFTDAVGSAGANAGYMYNDGTCDQTANSSDTHGATTIAPTFAKGLSLSQSTITLPTNSYNQEQAVLDGKGVATSAPSSSALAAELRNSAGSYWASASTNGVYVPSNSSNAIIGGGIFVEGNADSVTLSYSGSTAQVYTIVQGSTTTTVTINPTANTTVISSTTGHTTTSKTYTGVPVQTNTTTGTSSDACLLYVDGSISSLSGTIQDNTAVTITAASDITITGNVVYKTAVVDSSGNETTAAANGTASQTLGIYTAGGSVYLQAPSNNANMEIDASILVTKDNGGTCNYGQSCTGVLGLTGSNSIGTLTIVGGRIQSRSMIMTNPTISKRNVYFDYRYNGTFAPPFFPKLTTIQNPATSSSSLQRTGWVLRTAY
ncbi:MAG: hypothetical protein P4M01_00975 [Acidobacteriota bacterium]|nr:hypothetical protein [Acidobacteriota bacterium]